MSKLSDGVLWLLVSWESLFSQDSQDESGQTLIEYGLIIALVSIVAIIALAATGTSLKGIFTSTASKLHS